VKIVQKSKELSKIVDCTFGPHNKPVVSVVPGEQVQLETHDFHGGVVRPGVDAAQLLRSGTTLLSNPVTGPVYVEGAEPGDTLIVHILDIKVPDVGLTMVAPGCGAFEAWLTPPAVLTKYSAIKNGRIYYKTDHGKEIPIPLKPLVGTFGVAPPTESLSTQTPHKHGGNMDVADVCAGNKVSLPVGVKGALFGAGDVHAAQGDGEICGTGVEVPAVLTLKFELVKNKTIEWPRIESDEEIMTVSSARPLEDAARLAFREMVRWLNEDYGFSVDDAYMFLSLTARARIAQIVDPLYTVVAKLSKEYLKGL
jgi:acetamidase/formamidase